MIWLLRKELVFLTKESKEDFLHRIEEHTAYSKTKNFFTTLTDDYAIKTKIRGNTIIIRKRFMRRTIPIKVTTHSNGIETEIRVIVGPERWAVAACVILMILTTLFGVVISMPVFLPLAAGALGYLTTLVKISIEALWTKNLFLQKLLRNNPFNR